MGLPETTTLPAQLITAIKDVTKDCGQSGDLAEKWECRQSGVRLLQSICKLIAGVLLRNWYTVKPDLFKFLEMLALNESSELEPDLARDCNVALACLSTCIVPLNVLTIALSAIEHVSNSSSWKAKIAMLEYLQVHVFTNMALYRSQKKEAARVIDIITRLLKDERIEVREKAGKVLGGLLHCSFLPMDVANNLLDQYDIPSHLPAILMILADHLHDPQPIPATVKNVFQEFKRTHQDNWAEHKQKLTEDQLATLTDLLVSPSYYA